ncbi:MAG: hypothetical protein QOE93_1779 [Actinomycetota bacterium]|jgi:hypothetical protein|nr:hypothetical protein [Actinomycetota bacterium]
MIRFCPRCGAEVPHTIRGEWFDTSRPCAECGVAVADPPPLLAPSDAELTYGLDEWPVGDRAVLTEALVVDDIPYRWEPGVVLVVPDAVEAFVDGVLDDLEGSGPGDGEAPEADGGAEAQQAMSDLFVAADRLHHAPSDQGLADELVLVADVVAQSLPPYGMAAGEWARIQTLTEALVVATDGAPSEDEVAERAAALRDLLRPLV